MVEKTTEHSPESGFSHLFEKGKETQAGILEQNLLAHVGRHDQLTERSKKRLIEFSGYFVHTLSCLNNPKKAMASY